MTSNHNTPQATVVTLDDVATPNLQRYVHPSAEDDRRPRPRRPASSVLTRNKITVVWGW